MATTTLRLIIFRSVFAIIATFLICGEGICQSPPSPLIPLGSKKWVGGNWGYWGTPSNWSPYGVPSPSDIVEISKKSDVYVNGNYTCRRIVFGLKSDSNSQKKGKTYDADIYIYSSHQLTVTEGIWQRGGTENDGDGLPKMDQKTKLYVESSGKLVTASMTVYGKPVFKEIKTYDNSTVEFSSSNTHIYIPKAKKGYRNLRILPTGGVQVSELLDKVEVELDFTTNDKVKLKLLDEELKLEGNWIGKSHSTEVTSANGKIIFKKNNNQSILETHTVPNIELDKGGGLLTIVDSLRISERLELKKGDIKTNGRLHLLATSGKYAIVPEIDHPNDIDIDGDVLVDRFFEKPAGYNRPADWYRIGPIVKGNTLHHWDALFNLVTSSTKSSITKFDEATFGQYGNSNTNHWVPIMDFNTSLQAGKGYRTYFYNSAIDNGTISFTEKGELATGNVYINTTASNSPWRYGFNLVANPYACTLSWSYLLDEQSDEDDWDHAAYVWDSFNDNYIVYLSYANSNSLNITNYPTRDTLAYDRIAPGQAFFVFQWPVGNRTFRFTEEAKTNERDMIHYRTDEIEQMPETLTLGLKDQDGNSSFTKFLFGENNSNAFKRNEDAFQFGGKYVYLASKATGIIRDEEATHNLSINSMPYPEKDSTMALTYGAAFYGSYTMEFHDLDLLSNKRDVNLYDSFSDIWINLREQDHYTFQVVENPDSYAFDRFKLRFGQRPYMDNVTLNFPTGLSAGINSQMTLPLYVKDFKKMKEMAFGLEWDPEKISVESVENPRLGNQSLDLSDISNGKISFDWNKSEAINLTANDTLLALQLKFVSADTGKVHINIRNATGKGLSVEEEQETDASFTTRDAVIKLLPRASLNSVVEDYEGNNLDEIQWEISVNGQPWATFEPEAGIKEWNLVLGDNVRLRGSRKTDNDISPNVADLILTRRHILGVSEFDNPYLTFVADVNNDSRVSTIDVLKIRREILGIEKDDSPWVIVPETELDKIVRNEYEDLSEEYFIQLNGDGGTASFTALRRGIVSQLSPSPTSRVTGQEVNVTAGISFLDKDGILNVPIKTETESPLSGLQFPFSWDKQALELVGSQEVTEGESHIGKPNDGNSSLIWHLPIENGSPLQSGDHLINLKFRVKDKSFVGQTAINIGQPGNVTPLAVNENLKEIALNGSQVDIPLEDLLSGDIQFRVGPNPFNNVLHLEIYSPESVGGTVSFFSPGGKFIDKINLESSLGSRTFDWNFNLRKGKRLEPGIYLYKAEIGEKVFVGKVLAR
ncbi:hypothetical protein FUAX_31650 [Fulvitalea axinellae]|uniref:Cohesin domain-containing protein n=1 Tax=Fulvitalea axinellae TaxID=1182444 RepID=A0AAU9D453_9BACT|nr:hypothetical protein FUAX_31650 [Fulvitalea axinellae]